MIHWLRDKLVEPFQAKRLITSGLVAVSLAALGWLLTLPQGFISLSITAVWVLLALLLGAVLYFAGLPYPQKNPLSRFEFAVTLGLGLLAACFISTGLTSTSRYIFPLLPQHTLTLISTGGEVSIRPVECELTTLYINTFQGAENIERAENGARLIFRGPAQVSWTGWTGSQCKIYVFQGETAATLTVQWDHDPKSSVDVGLLNKEETPFEHEFPLPLGTELAVAVLLWPLGAFLTGLLWRGIRFLLAVSGEANEDMLIWQKVFTGLCLGTAAVISAGVIYFAQPRLSAPGVDSSVFQVIGNGWIHGQVPYRDLWDHKGPLIYFIDALGVLLGGAGGWGVWAITSMIFLAAQVLLFRVVQRWAGTLAAAGSLLAFSLTAPAVMSELNLVETVNLLFLAGGLLCLQHALEKETWASLFLAGLCGAGSFLLRPNLISVFLAGGLLWLLLYHHQPHWLWRSWEGMTVGFITGLLPFGVYFALQHALGDLWQQMFLYNFAYVASSPVEGTFFSRFFALPPQLIAVMAFLLIGGMLLLVQMSQGEFSEAQRRFAGLLFLTIAIEFVLSRLSRQSFLHYSTGLVLLAALLAGMILKGFARGIERISSPKSRHGVAMAFCAAGALLFLCEGGSQLRTPVRGNAEAAMIQEHVETVTARPHLLMWGDYASWNLLSGLTAANKYFYQYPLFNESYCTPEIGQEFLQQIETAQPTIVDTSAINPWVIPLDPAARAEYFHQNGQSVQESCLNSFFVYFDSHYHFVETLPDHFSVYLP
jgi:hypothetical protein